MVNILTTARKKVPKQFQKKIPKFFFNFFGNFLIFLGIVWPIEKIRIGVQNKPTFRSYRGARGSRSGNSDCTPVGCTSPGSAPRSVVCPSPCSDSADTSASAPRWPDSSAASPRHGPPCRRTPGWSPQTPSSALHLLPGRNWGHSLRRNFSPTFLEAKKTNNRIRAGKMCESVFQAVNLRQSINQSINRPLQQQINQLINRTIHQSIKQSIERLKRGHFFLPMCWSLNRRFLIRRGSTFSTFKSLV